jgi:hypothetical protein
LHPPPFPFAEGVRTPGLLEEDEIAVLIEAFGRGARCTREAGFDVLEVHTAHGGYPHGQFLSPVVNKRTDQWGGSHENRYAWSERAICPVPSGCVGHGQGSQPPGRDPQLEAALRRRAPELKLNLKKGRAIGDALAASVATGRERERGLNR